MRNLKNLRKESKITLEQLAKETGISNQMLSNYELEKSNPPIETILTLADYFNCSVDYLLGHQTNGTLYIDSLFEEQKKLVSLIKLLTRDQALIALGYFSEMLKIPYSEVRPARPF